MSSKWPKDGVEVIRAWLKCPALLFTCQMKFLSSVNLNFARQAILIFLSTVFILCTSLTRSIKCQYYMDRIKRIWCLSPMRAAKVQASLRICAVSPEPPLLAHVSSETRGTFRQKARSLAPLNGWACAVKICHDGMLKDTNSLDGAHIISVCSKQKYIVKDRSSIS